MISQLLAGIGNIPVGLALNVRNEVARLKEAHAGVERARARTRFRIPAKSFLVRGLTGLSADSNNQASNSGVTSKGLRCCARTERSTSFTSSLASAQAPERTCFLRKLSTSLATAIVIRQS